MDHETLTPASDATEHLTTPPETLLLGEYGGVLIVAGLIIAIVLVLASSAVTGAL